MAPTLGPGTKGGGPTRLIAIVLGVGLGLVVCRKRHDLVSVLSVVAVAFYFRLLFESELNWYYIWPVGALCLLLSLRRSWVRFGSCAVAFMATIGLGNRRVHSIAVWWPTIMLVTLVMLVAAVKWRPASSTEVVAGGEAGTEPRVQIQS